MATTKTLESIRELIEKNVGKKVVLRTDKGRNRVKENSGILFSSYSSLFVVQLDRDDKRKLTFSYSDVLTEKVVIKTIYNDEYIAL